jgi:hypothetical protein
MLFIYDVIYHTISLCTLDDTVENLELRLQTLLVSGKEIHSIEQYLWRYLALRYREDEISQAPVKIAADQVNSL